MIQSENLQYKAQSLQNYSKKNTAVNFKCHRQRNFLFEITRNTGHKYCLAVCLSERFHRNFRRKQKNLFG